MKKVGKTTRPLRYDLNQILYDYTVGVTTGFKGFDLVDRVPEELWMEVGNTVQEAEIKTKKKKCKNAELLSKEPLQIAENWRRKWQPTPVFFPGKVHGERSLGGCSP